MQEQQSMNELIKNNPLERFDEMFNVKLLNDIVENFTSDGEKCFINKFYMYLNYENKPEFVIDLNDVWELLGVNQKVSIVRLLEKSFKLNDDYTKEKILCNKENAKKWGGTNKHNFFLTTCCFKHLCLKIKTPQSYEIYEFYTKMTDFMHKLVYEQNDYMKKQLYDILMRKNRELQNKLQQLEETSESKDQQITNLTLENERLKECVEKQKITLVAVEIEHQSVYQNELIQEDEMTDKFNGFISTMCTVRQDVEESSVNMEGQLRIWLKTKPKKETFHAFKHYLDTRFKPARLAKQTEGHVVHGYIGVKLNPIEYVKKHINNDVEIFLFHVCCFAPTGKILNSTLLEEYQKWKTKLSKPCSENDMKELKQYLNSCEYVIKATVWATAGSNEGYYGVSLRDEVYKPNYSANTGKVVEKVVVETGIVIETWDTIAKAALSQKISAAKMSRSVKHQVVFKDYFYRAKL